ncbi:beta-xylosidase [Micromonospora zingiberis]|uniref:Beta-xylosidase n=1 Tax=Micromonospora zingiberis TaxID=2053011 RepID=A0A4R0FXE3_9ACTN|nr:family 43 glycosylhydrolase [Micromonospora zingiberis]TCB88754.1 beta-xylosidase [Micromonospora zingiberis]
MRRTPFHPRSTSPTDLPSRRATGRLAAALVVALTAGLLPATPAQAAPAYDVTAGLLLRYDLDQTAGTTVTDTSGHGRHGTLTGGTWTDRDGLRLDGVDDHVRLPDNLMAGLSSITVSVDVYVDPGQQTPYFIWGLGNPATSSSGTGYLFASGDAFRAAITTTNWSGERVTAKGGNLARGVWKSVTYTQTGTVGTLYEDGVQVARNTAVTVTPGAVGNGTTTSNNLGRSNYASDRFLRGQVANFRIYDRALDAAEVSAIALPEATRVTRDAASLDLGDLSAVTGALTLPTQGSYGAAITWASTDPATISPTGAVTRPAAGADPASVTLTATVTRGAATATRTFTATVLPDASDRERVEAAAAALALVHADDVRGNLTLPTSGLHGATVSWRSARPEIVAPDGVVNRPPNGAGDVTVTVTATVVLGAASTERNFELTVRQMPPAAPYVGYAFSYFTGNSIEGEKIYFAASQGNNALQWTELNGGRPVLESTFGTRGLRDPFLIRSPEGDRFFLIATDLSIGRNGDWDASQRHGSRYLEVWESTDLVNWSEQRHVQVSPPRAGNTWAPEAYWDDERGEYLVFWASKLYAENDPQHTGNTYNRMLAATTRDFVTFDEATIWQDRGESRIDSTVIKEGDTYYRFTKDEGGGGTGCSDIIQEKAASLTAVDLPGRPAWSRITACIGRTAGTSAVEGPTVFKANPGDTSGSKYYLFVDEYGGRGYIPLGTDDLENPNWRVPARYSLPASPRHGTVIPVTKRELDALTDAPPPVRATPQGLVLHYPLAETSGRTATDASGNGYHGTLAGDAAFGGGSLRLGGTDGHVGLPDDIMSGLDEITVSMEVNIAGDQATPYFIWGLGNSAGGAGNGYLFTTGNNYRTSLATGNWTTEETVTNGAALPRAVWQTLTYTLDSAGTARLYLDGVRVAERTGVLRRPGEIGGGRTTANYIGRSQYAADRFLKGQVRNFSLHNRALSDAEVAGLGGNGTSIVAVQLDSLKVPAMIDAATSTVTLAVRPGTDLRTLQPTFVVAPTSTVTPAGVRDYREPVRLTVTDAAGGRREWTVRAVSMGSPVLPGYNADPNIVRFGDTYYIYATTDGFPGWGSSTFKVWSSRNLVDWTEHDTILDLGPDVSWADHNAWAPAAIEKNGKYYFYFSAQQNIGVAVADSPLGPFVDPLGKPLVSKDDYNGAQQIDPAVFTDDDGRSYLYWGNGTPYVVPLNDDMISYDVTKRVRLTGLTDFREGLFLHKRAGTYYLSWSIDDTGSENYRVGYGTGTSPLGPFTARGEILTKDPSQGILGTGHHSVLQVPGTDDWYIAYHRFAIPGGNGTHRETTIDRLHHEPDGSIRRVVPTLTSVEPLRYQGGQPKVSISGAGRDGWYGASATLTVAAGNGVRLVEYQIDGKGWFPYREPVPLPHGRYRIDYRAQGVNLWWSETWSTSVQVDRVAPRVRATLNDRKLTIIAADPHSGVARVEYQVDNGAWQRYTAPVPLDHKRHVVLFRATDTAGNVGSGSLVVVAVLRPAPVAKKPPVVKGKPKVGATLTAQPGTWSESGLTFQYQWLRDGRVISGATSRTYQPKNADVGHRLSVRVTAVRAATKPGVATSARTGVVTRR